MRIVCVFMCVRARVVGFLLLSTVFLLVRRSVRRSINLNHNDVACFSVPSSVAKKVKRVTVDGNRLVNASFNGMSHLALVSLANNELESVPSFDGCKKLAELNLSKNRIASSVQCSAVHCSALPTD